MSFRFELGRRVVYRRGTPDEEEATVTGYGITIEGSVDSDVTYSITFVNGASLGGVAETDLTDLVPADRTRKAVESLGLGPVREVCGGHAASGHYSPPDSSEGYVESEE